MNERILSLGGAFILGGLFFWFVQQNIPLLGYNAFQAYERALPGAENNVSPLPPLTHQKEGQKHQKEGPTISVTSQPKKKKAGCYFIDAGANIGDSLQEFFHGSSKYVPALPKGMSPCQCTCHLFEANSIHNESLQKTKDKYPTCNINLHLETAVWTEDTELTFYTDNNPAKHFWGATLDQDRRKPEAEGHKVKAVNFANFLKENVEEGSWVFVKLDIEGSEYEVLQDLLDRGVAPLITFLSVEFHKSPKRNRKEKLIQSYSKHGIQIEIWH